MSKETNLDAEIRAESGKSAVKKVLAAGKIPSVIYGLGEDSLNIALAVSYTHLTLPTILRV